MSTSPARRVVVLGNGVAGASAAMAARGCGAEVVVIDGGSGASTLSPGALDGREGPSEDQRAGHACASGPLPFAGFARGACLLATGAGVLRRAAGRDLALLDLARLPAEGCIAVPTSLHHGWDAKILAAQWNDGAPASLAGRFVPLEATLLRFADERDMPDVDLAARHDDPSRLGWLADRLREALATSARGVAAILLPPWLGARSPRAAALSERLALPAGEILAAGLGPSGLRFEAARDEALAASRVEVRRTRALAVGPARAADREADLPEDAIRRALSVRLASGAIVAADAVILATGGLLGGGLRYTPSASEHAFAVPLRARATLELTMSADAPLGIAGRPLLSPGSLFGASPEQLAWPFQRPAPLERAGVLHEKGVVSGRESLYVAGELAADLPRTWLDSAESGAAAGRLAAW